MINRAIRYPHLFKIVDEKTQITHHGGNQQWYGKRWQRMSGCGPTVAANIYYYLTHSKNVEINSSLSKRDWVLRMDEMWKVVTPSFFGGVNTTKKFYDGLQRYIQTQGLGLQYSVCDVPKDKAQRPAFSEVIQMLDGALANDSPIAFLNLGNGEEKNLEPWHWVTIISLAYSEDLTQAFVDILDEGKIQRIDLRLWYMTTRQGGGFVYFSNQETS